MLVEIQDFQTYTFEHEIAGLHRPDISITIIAIAIPISAGMMFRVNHGPTQCYEGLRLTEAIAVFNREVARYEKPRQKAERCRYCRTGHGASCECV